MSDSHISIVPAKEPLSEDKWQSLLDEIVVLEHYEWTDLISPIYCANQMRLLMAEILRQKEMIRKLMQ